METSANNIGKKKWLTLSVRQKHTAIARFAVECLESGNFKKYQSFYDQIMSWSALDRFKPPAWLSDREALQNYLSFHQKLSGKPLHYFLKRVALPADKPALAPHAWGSSEISIPWKPKHQVTIALDQVFTPYNLGSILRVVDNFGFAGIVNSTAFLVGLEKTNTSIPIRQWQPAEAFILVLGNEAYGISKEIIKCCDQLVHIPMAGYKNSMNLSHALAAAAFYINENMESNLSKR
jgi:tRNA(Leu) C34 or U34 (ribose-2'-O)-methylase TrmL